MEVILGIVVLLLWIFGPRLFLTSAKSAYRAAQGKGSFGANFDAAWRGMAPLEMRLTKDNVVNEHHSFDIYRIDVKGLFPNRTSCRLIFCASIFDITKTGSDGKPVWAPVTCLLEQQQEPNSICYQHKTNIGYVEPDVGFVDWQTIGTFIPDTLSGPRKGTRKLHVCVRCYDEASPLDIHNGFSISGTAIATYSQVTQVLLVNLGYEEAREDHFKAEEFSLQIGIAVSHADGHLHETEGRILQNWVSKRLEILDDDKRDDRRKALNGLMRSTFADVRRGNFDLGRAVSQLRAIELPAAKTEAVELCLDLMSADGEANAAEVDLVHRIARQLEVDYGLFENMRDKRIAGLATRVSTSADYFSLLGMERNWDRERIRAHLNTEYSRWNSRAESMRDPEKRAQAEQRLEQIAAARRALLN